MSPITAFATAIFAKTAAHREPARSRAERQRLAEGIGDDLKKYTTFTPHRVSAAAHAVARALPTPVDLHAKNWHDQPRFDKGRVRFIVEHKRPVSMLRARCLEAISVAEVEAILDRELVVAWITREEDARLTANGHHHDRPDPDAAYAEAGIELLPLAPGGGGGEA